MCELTADRCRCSSRGTVPHCTSTFAITGADTPVITARLVPQVAPDATHALVHPMCLARAYQMQIGCCQVVKGSSSAAKLEGATPATAASMAAMGRAWYGCCASMCRSRSLSAALRSIPDPSSSTLGLLGSVKSWTLVTLPRLQ